jgi:hypothetical protein
MLDSELASLKRLPLLPPDEVRERAQALRRRATACADLAGDCLTEDAKRVLNDMAEELGERADELEAALLQIRRTYGASLEAEVGETLQG